MHFPTNSSRMRLAVFLEHAGWSSHVVVDCRSEHSAKHQQPIQKRDIKLTTFCQRISNFLPKYFSSAK
jgi:hypothetical protein